MSRSVTIEVSESDQKYAVQERHAVVYLEEANGHAARQRSDKGVAVRVFLTCWLVFAVHFATNTVREIFPALSLGDHLSFDVSEYNGLHPDIFELEGRGTFINNNPGASMIGAIPYLVFRPLTDRINEKVRERRQFADAGSDSREYNTIYPMAQEFYRAAREKGFDIKFGLAAAVMQAFAMAPISAFAAVVMYWILLSIIKRPKSAVLLALLFAFATPVIYRTAQLNQNILVAHFALFAFALLWRPWAVDPGDTKPKYFWAGLCTGFTVVLDYSGLVAVIALSGYAAYIWFADTNRSVAGLAKFAAGVGICAAVLMAYQWSSFGNPILPAQSYMPAANYTDLGYRGFSLPSLDLLFQTAFGMRYGLFTSAPFMLLVFAVPIWASSKARWFRTSEIVFILAFTILFFVFCAANQYGRMQFGTGVRHIVPVVPFVFLLAANVFMKIPKLPAAIFVLITTYWSWCLAMYRDVEQGLGVLESIKHISLEGFRLPWLSTIERMGFVENASALPILLLTAALIAILWTAGKRPGSLEFRY